MVSPSESGTWFSEALGALPLAVALFSPDGSLLCASQSFLQALRVGSDAYEAAQAVRARFSDDGARASLLQSGGIAQQACARPLSNGQFLVWLEEVGETTRSQREAFLGIAQHDLRAAIANSRSYASLLLSPRMELGERAQRCAEVIQRNADRALRLVGECFDLLLFELDALDLDRARAELRPLFEELVAQARSLAASRGGRLEVEMPSHLPTAMIDRPRLGQAVLAFVAHSLGRVRKREPVRVVVKEQRKAVVVEVSDGEELASGDRANAIYDPEARAIAEGKLGDGFCLGLARVIVEAHGGEVGVRIGEGSGSALFFTLPIDPNGSADRPLRSSG